MLVGEAEVRGEGVEEPVGDPGDLHGVVGVVLAELHHVQHAPAAEVAQVVVVRGGRTPRRVEQHALAQGAVREREVEVAGRSQDLVQHEGAGEEDVGP